MIALARFLKGSTSVGELMNMPNRFLQVLYKEYLNFMNDPERQKAAAAEEVTEALQGDA